VPMSAVGFGLDAVGSGRYLRYISSEGEAEKCIAERLIDLFVVGQLTDYLKIHNVLESIVLREARG